MTKLEDRLHDLYHPTSKKNLAQLIDSAVFPGLQGGPHDHINAAKAVAFGEALKPEFKVYAAQIVKNAKALAEDLMALAEHNSKSKNRRSILVFRPICGAVLAPDV